MTVLSEIPLRREMESMELFDETPRVANFERVEAFNPRLVESLRISCPVDL